MTVDRVISPPRHELERLRQPLEPGEWAVFKLFDEHLAPEWEIYIQPHMNGLRPDFVLLNPNVGIAVFEVKDWDLDAIDYRVEPRNGAAPELLGSRSGMEFSKQRENPVEQIKRYKEELYSLYCPRLKERSGFAVITAGIIFPYADDQRVKALLLPSLQFYGLNKYPKNNPVAGRDALMAGDLSAIFPESFRQTSAHMSEEHAKDLRNWLVEPDFSQSQRRPLELDDNQRALITSRTKSGYRRIKGAAGSGKSLVLAARAAELARQGKQVLVVTYNITLLHYLMDVAVRWPRDQGNTRKDVTWLNFHSWCKRVCEDTGCSEQYRDIWKFSTSDVSLDHRLPELVNNILANDTNHLTPRYDAVLVDEGQDFLPSWWAALRKVCKPEGEMLLVADATQDIYEKAHSWTDEAMLGAGFRGDWSTLHVSYRMPSQALVTAREFANRYLPKDSTTLPNNPQASLALEPCYLRWVQVDQSAAPTCCIEELLRFFEVQRAQNLAIADATFLCSRNKFGMTVVEQLIEINVKTVHTFLADKNASRRQKMGFYMGDAKVKATTMQSFKGWESRIIVLYIDHSVRLRDLALIYTGITRLKRSPLGSCLTVVCSAPELEGYGQSWPEFERQ